MLVEQAKDKGLDPEELDFYLDFFRYGVPPHGGFGMGLARVLMLHAAPAEHPRDDVPVPRPDPPAALGHKSAKRPSAHPQIGASKTARR